MVVSYKFTLPPYKTIIEVETQRESFFEAVSSYNIDIRWRMLCSQNLQGFIINGVY